MNYLNWFYSEGVLLFYKRWKFLLSSHFHNYSPLLLLKTLFAPWKRIVDTSTSKGFHPGLAMEKLLFNLYSRVIGAFVRIFLLLFSFIYAFLLVMGGIIAFFIWICFPFLGVVFYQQKLRDPHYFLDKLRLRLYESPSTSRDIIFRSSLGIFLLSHLGISFDAVPAARDFTVPESFHSARDVIETYLSHCSDLDVFYRTYGITMSHCLLAADWWERQERVSSQKGLEEYLGRPSIGLDLLFGFTPTLDSYSADISPQFSYSDHLFAREDLVSRMERTLSTGKEVLLHGMPGVGRKTVIFEMVYLASQGKLSSRMSYRRFVEVQTQKILSQSIDSDQKKALFARILSEAASAGNIILVFYDIDKLVSSTAGVDFSDVFEKALDRHTDLSVIGVCGSVEYERFIVPNIRFRKFFEPLEVVAPTRDEALSILIDAAERIEEKKGITILVPALQRIVDVCDRYVTDIPFPEKALDLLDEVAYGISSGQHLTVLSVNAVFGQKTGIPFQTIDSDAKQKLASIEDLIHESLVNQHTAVSLLGKALRARTMGVKDDRRPVGSFLFLGPTGVGKTETAKVLSRVYYGSESYITRFDMAEYASSEGYERLIGSSTRGIPGTLAVAIRNKPASLLLLDEIEKATPDIYNIFLTLLDEGYLVDALGKKINCQHLFLVATSNAGAEYIREIVSQGVTGEELQQKVLDHVLKERYFAPEFLNRFDAVVVYEPLTQDHLVSIADKMLSHLSQTLLSRNIHLTWSPETAKKLASDGYTPAFGARAMRRVVDMEIGDLLSRSFLSGDLVDGSVAELLPGEGKHTYILSVKS